MADTSPAWGESPVDALINTSMVADSLDRVGLRNQVLSQWLPPLLPGRTVAGRARTCAFVPDPVVAPERPYDDAIDFIDGSSAGDLLVIATGESNQSAFWGELFSAAATGRGVTGVVTDGNVRDTKRIEALDFPVFARSRRPLDFKGRMKLATAMQPVDIGGVVIHPGDLMICDDDGIVCVPQEAESETLEFARERAQKESTVLEELIAGATLREVWTKYGVL